MNTKALLSFLLVLSLPFNLVAQQSKTIHDKLLAPRQTNQQPDIQADQLWPKFYGGNTWTYGEDVDELKIPDYIRPLFRSKLCHPFRSILGHNSGVN